MPETNARALPIGCSAGHRRRGRWSMLIAALLTLWAVGAARAQDLAPPPRSAVRLDVRGVIGPATADYLTRALTSARDRDAALVILRMDTPGGLDTSMREIVRAILASPVPVATFVAPAGARAASAGTYILYASHLAAMAPGTNLGAATPIQLGGPPQPMDGGGKEDGSRGEGRSGPADAHSAKAVNDAVAYIRGLARLHGRNADWAERAVREAASLPAEEALDQGVIEIVARDLDALLRQANGRTVRLGSGASITLDTTGLTVVPVEPNWRTRLLAVITDPNIALVLMLIGIYGIIFEFMNPGMVAPGVIGAIALLLGLFALNTLPISYAGVALVLLGIGFLIAEAFVPSFGALGLGGAVALGFGAVIMIDSDAAVPAAFRVAPEVAGAVVIASAAFSFLVLGAAVRARRRAVVTGAEGLIGSVGEVIRADARSGWVHVQGETWRARWTDGFAPEPGQRVTVMARDGLTLLVGPEAR
jgi:membrane-bound serine protease (ClpP class)